jgi:hypothetical protein
MPLTVAETVSELERLKHQRAVWMEIVEFLSRFVDKESRKADHGIDAEGCISSPVPQEAVREFIDRINEEEIEPLNQEIGALENLYVEEDENGPEGDPSQKKSQKEKKGQSKKGVIKTGSKETGSTARVRTLTRASGRKDQGVG